MTSQGWSVSRMLWLTAACWSIAMTIETLLLIQLEFSSSIALVDAAISQTLLALAIFGMMFLMRYYRPGKQNLWRLFDWTLVISAIVFTSQYYILRQMDYGKEYSDFLQRTMVIRGVMDWLIILAALMAGWLAFYWYEQRESEIRKEQSEKLARESELGALRQQLHPHFLFNSLNSISALVGSRPEEARKMVQQLSDFLRGTLRKDDQSLVPLEEELHHLRLYLEIEKVRFGHRLQVDIQSEETVVPPKLPPLILQPVVENAIKFGLYDTVGEITIRIHTKVEENMLIATITNPFDPETAVPQKGTGFGLSSVQRRLFLLYARNDLMTLSQSDNEFTTTLKIPQHG